MNHDQRVGINKAAKKVINIAKTQKHAEKIIGELMVKIAANAIEEERQLWELTISRTPGIGPKMMERILKARYGDEDTSKVSGEQTENS